MDIATAAALRAVVAGLRKSGAISDDPHVTAIVRELEAIEGDLQRYGTDKRTRVRQLCMDLASDAGLTTKIKAAEAEMGFNL